MKHRFRREKHAVKNFRKTSLRGSFSILARKRDLAPHKNDRTLVIRWKVRRQRLRCNFPSRVCVPDEGVFQSPMIGRVTYIRCTCSMRDKKCGQKGRPGLFKLKFCSSFIYIVSNLPHFRGCKRDSLVINSTFRSIRGLDARSSCDIFSLSDSAKFLSIRKCDRQTFFFLILILPDGMTADSTRYCSKYKRLNSNRAAFGLNLLNRFVLSRNLIMHLDNWKSQIVRI